MTESIKAAAISYEGLIFSVERPARHHDVLALMSTRGVKGTAGKSVQGFLTDSGHFVDRKEAKRIARAAEQLLPRASASDSLFSEDVW